MGKYWFIISGEHLLRTLHHAMWHFISEHISETTQSLFVCQHRTEVQGGDTHKSFVLRDDTRRYFVKICTDEGNRQLACEAEGLAAIAATERMLTPAVICHGVAQDRQGQCEYLVLGFVKFISADDNYWSQLGAQLASMHQQPMGTQYGWQSDNFIGKTLQKNLWQPDWSSFFAEHRIGCLLESLAKQQHRLVNIDVFVTQVARFLHHHQPQPALVHGDLWSGNAGFCKRGPIVFDPAVYLGDRETDLAMSELFGRFPDQFYVGYNQTYAIDPDYAQRKALYQLYHLLNHALIFGGHYLPTCKSAIIAFQQQL